MKYFRKYNSLTLLLLIVFGFASLATCTHGLDDDSFTFSYDRGYETNGTTNIDHLRGASNGNGHEVDSHHCPCICHTPVSASAISLILFANNTETISANLPKIQIKGFFNRIERPPQFS